MTPEGDYPEIKTECDWNTKDEGCSYPGDDDDVYKTWGGNNCQFNKNGQCMQAIWRRDEIIELREQQEKFHENWRELHDGQSLPNR